MAGIRVENLTKEFGDTVALDDVSFEIPEGEFAVVLGTSGSGKSTLLRCVNGLTAPTDGQVTIQGETVTKPRNDVAMVFQQHNIIDGMSAYSNALSGALGRTDFTTSVLRTHDRKDKLQALDALETVGLLDEAEQRAARMSGGQQQRVGIARALVQNPNIILADEPVASLDPGSAQTVMRYLREAAEERGLTAMISLHQVNLARQFGQRFIGLADGKLVFDGYRDDLTFDVIDKLYGGIDMEQFLSGKNGADESGDSGSASATATGSEAKNGVTQ
ncbi:putative phosphate/phosphonate ABC transporter ATP-binding protein [Natrialba chahannaoensis JCM 10990]|uniref:Putative phosphate/phosphonate ABC transporter ATP-binding protein n=1 Tax=Natrialba chahannaoensis JCM 10990 TaxID=1227492 RepID=M0AXU1_9EURY|nr:phosphonate ABC transporter ATP-binding protein [Natrialba chahannaoensis]ELZ02239.1 putative phosphate/phosphonate ABC transporter ATP-binding protein [Natrialba chahannaoensis JCM 10990]